MPTLLLFLALATVFVFGGGRDHPYHEGQDHHDELTWLHMTVALNLSPVHGFLGFDRLVRDADGRLDYEAYNRFPVLGHALIRLATLPFPEDAPAQLAAARLLMLAFFAAAATLAYFALCRLAGGRWAALAATLLAFSGYYALYYNDMVATQGVVDLFGLMLVFHGMAAFAAEGRFGQLLAKACTALLLGWHVYALLLPFVLLGLAVACRRRDWAGFRRHFTLGAVAVGFGTMVLAANFSQEYLAYGGEVAPTRLPSVESMLYRTGLAGLQADAGKTAGGEADAAVERVAWLALAKRQLKRMAWSAPYAVGYFVGDGRPDADLAEGPLVVLGIVAFGLLGAIAVVLFVSPATRHRLPLAALALAGPLWGFGLPNSYFAFEGLFYVGVPLAFFALVLQHLERLAPGRIGMLAGVAVAATFPLSSFLMAQATMPNPAHVAYEKALAADVHAIRERLSAAPERKTILVSDAMDACGKYGQPGHLEPWRVDWKYHLAGLGMGFVKSSARRFADFVVSERIDGARTLTPGNRLLFLYDRASHEDALHRYEQYAQRRTPVLDAPNYDVYFVERNAGSGAMAAGKLLYFRDHCPQHEVNDRFFAERIMMAGDARVFVHVWPAEANDLPADRREFGFENVVDFEQLLSGWRQDGQCYAVCRLPDYDIASIRAGTATTRRRKGGTAPRASYDVIWEGSFSPRQAAGSTLSSPPPHVAPLSILEDTPG